MRFKPTEGAPSPSCLSSLGAFLFLLSIAPRVLSLSSHDAHSFRTSLRSSPSNGSTHADQVTTSSANYDSDSKSFGNAACWEYDRVYNSANLGKWTYVSRSLKWLCVPLPLHLPQQSIHEGLPSPAESHHPLPNQRRLLPSPRPCLQPGLSTPQPVSSSPVALEIYIQVLATLVLGRV